MAYIGNSPVQDETVTSAQIVDGAIVDADVNSSAAIAFSKMANLTASRLLVSDGSGDVSVSNVTSAEALLLDGGTSATSTTLAAADRLIVNDNGTIVQVALSDFETFIEGAIDTLSSAMTFSSTVTVGSDGSGQDVIFYSGTSGDNLTWDSSEECLTITGTDGAQALKVADGDLVVVDKIYLNDNDGGEYISGDGTDLTITSGNDIVLAVGSAGSVYPSGDGGTQNTYYGYDAGTALASGGNYNTLFGYGAGAAISTGDFNIAIGGYVTMDSMITGARNIAIGAGSMTASGAQTGVSATNGASDNIAIGTDSMGSLDHDSATRNIAIGNYAADGMGTGAAHLDNIFMGYGAGGGTWSTNANINNIGIGNYVMDAALGNGGAAENNTAVGHSALSALTTGDQNTVLGGSAGAAITEGEDNVLIGHGAGDAMTSQSKVVAVGRNAAGALNGDNADATVAIGHVALTALTTGNGNVAVGTYALDAMTVGDNNTAVGIHAGGTINADDGNDDNTFIGAGAGLSLPTASQTTCVGYSAGRYYDAGSGYVSATGDMEDCTLIGSQASASSNTPTNQTVIGEQATGQSDDSVTLGNASVTDVYMSSDKGAKVHCSTVIGSFGNVAGASGGTAAGLGALGHRIYTNNDGDLDNVTLADGESGQVMYFTVTIVGGSDTIKITPATAYGFTQITFNADGEGCIMVFETGVGWVVVGNNGGTLS